MSTLSLLQTHVGAVLYDSDRFCGVPFFFRTGKRFDPKGTMAAVVFAKLTPSLDIACGPNVLTIYIQPNEGFY